MVNLSLQRLYNSWRSEGVEAAQGTGLNFTWDCGEGAARLIDAL